MPSDQQLTAEQIAPLRERERIDGATASELIALFEGELGTSTCLPDGQLQRDPRSGDRILFNSGRAKRPHDNQLESSSGGEDELLSRPCLICNGKSTGILDVAELSEGVTFINKNLYPVLFPRERADLGASATAGEAVHGLHLLQWTSSIHHLDWHNMPQRDCEVVLSRLAALEGTLLESSYAGMPDNAEVFGDAEGRRGYVGIVKNYGALVGGSLIHGHQQIAYSNIMPRRLADDWGFERERGERYADYILRETPEALRLRDYGAATLLTPYYMRRPFDMQLVLHDTSKRYLYELDAAEVAAVARALREAIQLIRSVMPRLGRQLAYNVIVHNGPGAGLYLDLLPYTQEVGGYEHLGLILCQADPAETAKRARELLASLA
jgi:galactose-1-phosphate uridylyltransferase